MRGLESTAVSQVRGLESIYTALDLSLDSSILVASPLVQVTLLCYWLSKSPCDWVQ